MIWSLETSGVSVHIDIIVKDLAHHCSPPSAGVTKHQEITLSPVESINPGAVEGSSITDAGAIEGHAIIAPAELPA